MADNGIVVDEKDSEQGTHICVHNIYIYVYIYIYIYTYTSIYICIYILGMGSTLEALGILESLGYNITWPALKASF